MTANLTGSGAHTYEIVRPWPKLPPHIRLGNAASVSVGPDDLVHVYQRTGPPVVTFDTDGVFVRAWDPGYEVDAHGIDTDSDGNLYLVDRDAHTVIRVNPQGEVDLRLNAEGTPRFQAPFNHPSDVHIADNGDIWVSDGYANFSVHRFSADGQWQSTWGEPGRGAGQFRVPHGIWTTTTEVFVADRENGRLQVLDHDGRHLRSYDHLFRPTGVFVNTSGYVFVVDLSPSLTIISPEGNLIARGRPVPDVAHGIAGDSQGNLYVAEARFDTVTQLRLRR